MDIGIIGGGFFGVSTALLAEERGHTYTVYDADKDDAASPSAMGVIDEGWFDSEGTNIPDRFSAEDEEWAIEWLMDMGNLDYVDEHYTTLYGTDDKLKEDSKIMGDPHEFLELISRVDGTATQIQHVGDRWSIDFTDRSPEYHDAVVVAAGIHTDEILRESGYAETGVQPLVGRALIVEPETKSTEEVIEELLPHEYYFAAYRHCFIRPWHGNIRIGDSVEGREPDEETLMEFKEAAEEIIDDTLNVVDRYEGCRPVVKKDGVGNQFVVEHLDSYAVAATGGHRIGWMTSPLAAQWVLDTLDGSQDVTPQSPDVTPLTNF